MSVPVSKKSANTINTRVVPIIFVPGIMGTRLKFPDDDERWDPDHRKYMLRKWAMWGPDRKRSLLHYTTEAKIMHEYPDESRKSVIKSYYGDFLELLDGMDFSPASCPVYVVGYDWRQSNWDSATLLRNKIERVLKTNEAQKAIVITHSMGGLVTRAALLRYPEEMTSKIAGVIHVVQPVAGAVTFYRRIFTGMKRGPDGGWAPADIGFRWVGGTTPYEFLRALSGMRGAFELLPTRQYRYVPQELESNADLTQLRFPWESTETGREDQHGRQVYSEGTWENYLEDESPPGLYNTRLHSSKSPYETDSTKSIVRRRILEAASFHRSLGLHMHDNTWAIYGTGLETDVAIQWPDNVSVLPFMVRDYRRPEGDGTVPDQSADCLFMHSHEATAQNARNANKRQFVIDGLDHSLAFNNDGVRKVITELIKLILRSMETEEAKKAIEDQGGVLRLPQGD